MYTALTDSATPMMTPPIVAPTMLPMPPRTVMTNAFRVKVLPIWGKM